MAQGLDKWQERAVARHAEENGVTPEAALAELYPDAAPARRKLAAPKADAAAKSGKAEDAKA